jgi:hypothetical protein
MPQTQTTVQIKSNVPPNNKLSHIEFNNVTQTINLNAQDVDARIVQLDTSIGAKADQTTTYSKTEVDSVMDAVEPRLNAGIDPTWGSQYKGILFDKAIPSFIPTTNDNFHRIFDDNGNVVYEQEIPSNSDAAAIMVFLPAINAVLDALPVNAKLWVMAPRTPHLELAKRTARPNHQILLGSDFGYAKIGTVDSAAFLNINGTLEYPIAFRALKPGRCRITYPSVSRMMRIWQCSHILFHGIESGAGSLDVVGPEEATGTGLPTVLWGTVLGQAFGSESSATDWEGNVCSPISHNLTFEGCKIGPVGQALFVIASDSYNIALKYCEIHGSGYRWGKKHNAEGIYIGSGADASQVSSAHVCHDVYIKGCNFNDIGRGQSGGEAIDLKNQTYNVTVEDCLFDGITLDTQGCITVGHAQVTPEWTVNNGTINVLIHRNTFSNLKRRTLWSDVPPEHPYYSNIYEDPANPPSIQAQGIHIGKNGVRVISNTFLSVEDDTIALELSDGNVSNTTGPVLLKNNRPNTFSMAGSLTGASLNLIQE